MTSALALATVAAPLASGLAIQLCAQPVRADAVNRVCAVLTAAIALTLAITAFADGGASHGSWWVVDGATELFVAVTAVIGAVAAFTSPIYLAGAGRGFFRAAAARRLYYLGFYLFWAALLALPLVDNLGVAWILVEATTGASALLVAYSGRRSALEAGWKYLVLTTLGLTIALLGIVVLYAGLDGKDAALATLDWRSIAAAAGNLQPQEALTAFLLIIGGLAAKIGWAPVHNWLPDAHSEAPPPVSALLSALLLPTVMLVAWRVLETLGPAVRIANETFMAFGLVSLAIAVPFLWRPMAWKRLLAYSSLEHMGILAIGIGFATPLATAGVVLHFAGHALAKALGFFAAIPLLRHQRDAAGAPAHDLIGGDPATATAVGVSLGTLSGLPPFPLFFGELLILMGGVAAGQLAVVTVTAALLALGFVGLAHSLIEGLAGGARQRRWGRGRTVRATERLAAGATVALLGLSCAAWLLPGSTAVRQLMGGMS